MIAKRIFLMIITVVIGISLTTCTAQQKENVNEIPLQSINLVYYTIGNPDKDLSLVNDEINKLLKQKLNITIKYHKIPWGEYQTKLSTIISSGGDFDIAFASTVTQGDFTGNAKKKAWLDLDEYLNTYGKQMHDAINPQYWDGIRLNGKIYGVPTNKEIAVPELFMYPKELIERYRIDITQYKTIESLEPLLEKMKYEEPDYIGFELDSLSRNFFAIDGYEYILDQKLPLMIHSKDKDLQLINIAETDIGYQRLKTIRRYYTAGYINQDAAHKESGGLKKDEKVFCKMSSGGPYSEIIWSNDRGYDIVAQSVSPKIITTESARGGVMVVNSKTKYPQQCVEFLNLLNTDSELRNLFNFGIEGKHYKLDPNDQINRISNDYAGVQYTQGNWFILKTVIGEPVDKWEEFRKYNEDAVPSEALGFTPDLSILHHEISQISKVYDKYFSPLMTGTVDTDVYLPRYQEELRKAGIETVQIELQRQIDEWKKDE